MAGRRRPLLLPLRWRLGVPGSSYTGSRLPQPAGAQLRGIWGDGTTIWICWVSARTPGATTNIWAYTAATFARDSSKDITPAVTAADDRAGHPSGRLWGEALTLPTPRTIVYMLTAAGGNDLGVVAYDLSDGNAVQPDLGLTHFGLTTSNQVADVEGFDLVPGMGNERLARLYINNPALPGTAQLQAYRLTRVGLRLERSDNLGDVVIDGLPEFPSNDPNIVRAIYEAFRRGDTGDDGKSVEYDEVLNAIRLTIAGAAGVLPGLVLGPAAASSGGVNVPWRVAAGTTTNRSGTLFLPVAATDDFVSRMGFFGEGRTSDGGYRVQLRLTRRGGGSLSDNFVIPASQFAGGGGRNNAVGAYRHAGGVGDGWPGAGRQCGCGRRRLGGRCYCCRCRNDILGAHRHAGGLRVGRAGSRCQRCW